MSLTESTTQLVETGVMMVTGGFLSDNYQHQQQQQQPLKQEATILQFSQKQKEEQEEQKEQEEQDQEVFEETKQDQPIFKKDGQVCTFHTIVPGENSKVVATTNHTNKRNIFSNSNSYYNDINSNSNSSFANKDNNNYFNNSTPIQFREDPEYKKHKPNYLNTTTPSITQSYETYCSTSLEQAFGVFEISPEPNSFESLLPQEPESLHAHQLSSDEYTMVE